MEEQGGVDYVAVPMALMGKIINIINTLPYGRVAPVATEIGLLIQKHQQQKQAGAGTPLGGPTGNAKKTAH